LATDPTRILLAEQFSEILILINKAMNTEKYKGLILEFAPSAAAFKFDEPLQV
jgi:hypothetical protein